MYPWYVWKNTKCITANLLNKPYDSLLENGPPAIFTETRKTSSTGTSIDQIFMHDNRMIKTDAGNVYTLYTGITDHALR